MDNNIVLRPRPLNELLDQIDRRIQKVLAKSADKVSEPSHIVGIAGAAKILGRSKQTVYRLTSNDKSLPFKKHGARLVFDVDRLQAWMDSTGRK